MKLHRDFGMIDGGRIAACLTATTVAALLSCAVNADTFTWTGDGADKKWSTADNWSPASAMTSSDTANFQTGTLASDSVTYDSGAFSAITVQSGAWTANVSSACFSLKPITIASGAQFALAGASAAVNPFSTNLNANAVSGLLDLGGAEQTIATTMNGKNTGFFRNGGEIRNGTVTIDGVVSSASMQNTVFTIGPGASLIGAARLYLNGARIVVDGGTFNNTFANSGSNHPIGNGNESSVVVRNGGTLSVVKEVWLGFKKRGQLIGDGGTVDLGGNTLYIAVRDDAPSVLTLTNSTLTCGVMYYGYNTQYTVGNQTVILKDSTVNLSKLAGRVLNSSSSLLFDGAVLVPKGAAADFLPDSATLPTPTLGEGGLIVSNAYDVTIAKGMAGEGGLVKKGAATLTLSGANTFTGGIDLQEGTLVIDGGASFADSTIAVADGTTLRVKFSPDGGFATTNLLPVLDANTQGKVTLEIDATDGLPEEGRTYTLFAPGLSVAALNRISVVPNAFYTFGFTQEGALTLTLERTPVTHVWAGGGADAKWTTTGNWDVDSDFGTLDRVVFGGTGGYSVYDCADGLQFEIVDVVSGCHTANVATASFYGSPITVASGATFVLENAGGVTNPFSTVENTNVVAGILDLGGASQTILTTMSGNDNGFFRDGGEVRNGTLAVNPGEDVMAYLQNTTFTIGQGATLSGAIRLDVKGGHIVVDGGTLSSSFSPSELNNHPIGRNSESSVVLRNGGRLESVSEIWLGFTARGVLIGDGATIDNGEESLYMSVQAAESCLALTNSTLTCDQISFGYKWGSKTPGCQTMVLNDTVVNCSKFAGAYLNEESSLLFDGTTLVPKGAAADFMPASSALPAPTLGAGGLTVSNAYDVTIAKGLAGTGALVKKGDATLTLSGANTFTGGIDVREGALAIGAGASFADSALTMADGTTVTVAYSPDGGFATTNVVLALDANTDGKVAVEIDMSAGMPDPNTVYTLFAPGLDAATMSRVTIDPAFSPAFSDGSALTITFSPKTHAWTGGGADAKWTTAANWSVADPIYMYDHIVFSSLTGHSVYDCTDGLLLGDITAGFGVHTANVETASFANVPITVASGAEFALENAGDVTNAFSTLANTNVIAGVLDLGGATQTFTTLMTGNGEGSFRDGGEIRNGTVKLVTSNWQSFENMSFTFGPGANVTSSARFYLQNGAHLTIDGGTFTSTHNNNHVIGGAGTMSTLEVLNGGRLTAPLDWYVGHNKDGALVGDGCVLDFGAKIIYLSNHNVQSVLALTNSVLTCSVIQFSYDTSRGGCQTVVLKDSLVNLSRFAFKHKTDESTIVFDGATLVPSAASASFMPSDLPSPSLGADGLVISNAFDVTVAAGMTGDGGILKTGDAKLTVTGDQAFAGNVVVSNGTFAATSTFAGGLLAASGTTIDVADATFGDDVAIEGGVTLAATNGVDWATTKSVLIAKTTADMSFPGSLDAAGRHFFAKTKNGVTSLYYGKQAGTIVIFK